MADDSKTKPAANARPSYTGRGGAGNIAPASPSLQPVDLETPTIKQQHYTTGRGGSGNIVSNDNPDNARLAQDVGPHPSALKDGDADDGAGKSFGRGGAANVVKKVKDAVSGGPKKEEKK